MKNVGLGSNRQDFEGDLLIILSTVSSETCKGSNFWRIRRRVNIIFGARGDKVIDNNQKYVLTPHHSQNSSSCGRLIGTLTPHTTALPEVK